MAYDLPLVVPYVFGEVDFGEGDATFGIRGPAGWKGRVRDVHVSSTETFTNTTTEGAVRLGISGTLTKYVDMDLGTLAAAASQLASDTAGDIVEADIASDDVQALVVTCVAPTGGTPAGKGHVTVVIEWYR